MNARVYWLVAVVAGLVLVAVSVLAAFTDLPPFLGAAEPTLLTLDAQTVEEPKGEVDSSAIVTLLLLVSGGGMVILFFGEALRPRMTRRGSSSPSSYRPATGDDAP
jgi:hypothetical protein